MAIPHDIRIGKLLPSDFAERPEPDTSAPPGYMHLHTSTSAWRAFRQPIADEWIWGREPSTIDDEPDLDIRRVIDAEGARPSSLIVVDKPSSPDKLHDLQLLRDLAIINERTAREPCSLPKAGLPVQEKCKPKVSPLCLRRLPQQLSGTNMRRMRP